MSASQESGTQEQIGVKPRLAEVVPAVNIPDTRDVIEVVLINGGTVLYRAGSDDEARQWANENLDYRYVVDFRPFVG